MSQIRTTSRRAGDLPHSQSYTLHLRKANCTILDFPFGDFVDIPLRFDSKFLLYEQTGVCVARAIPRLTPLFFKRLVPHAAVP